MAAKGSGTKVYNADLRSLVPLDNNARYMAGKQWQQLVGNIKRDGKLTSVPLVAKAGSSPLTKRGEQDSDALEILSGNHRTAAAIEAGIGKAQVMEITDELTREQKISIQLSHNQIEGQDDPNILRDLYESLSFEWKEYSGLDDDAFKVEELDLQSLGAAGLDYEELTILFLPDEMDVFDKALKTIGKKAKERTHLAAHYGDFNVVFDALVSVKEQLNIHNSALALRRMSDLALERLEQMDG